MLETAPMLMTLLKFHINYFLLIKFTSDTHLKIENMNVKLSHINNI